MMKQLQQISKTIPLITNDQRYNAACLYCPHRLLLFQYCNQYIVKAELITKSHKTIQQGIFSNFNIQICLSNHSSQYLTLKKNNHHGDPCFKNSEPINSDNYEKFLVKQEKQLKTAFKTVRDFDMKMLSLITTIKEFANFSANFHLSRVKIKNNQDIWQIPIQSTPSLSQQHWYENLSTKDTIDMLKTQQYLTKIHIKNNPPIRQPQIQQQPKQDLKPQPNKQLIQPVQQLRQQLIKSTIVINKMLLQFTNMKNRSQTHHQQISIQSNQLAQFIDDLHQSSKQNQSIIHTITTSQYQLRQSFVTTNQQQQPLPIDLNSSFINKFQIVGSEVKYIGQNEQETQLLSSKHFDGALNAHLKSTLKILHTKSKCIKFGIIDSKYIAQRSAWKSPNIIYLHGWGHTMINGHQQLYNLCDFGTGDIIQLNIYFIHGQILWKINNKLMIYVHNQDVKLLVNHVHQWTPFIAMYHSDDQVQWKITNTQ